MGWLACMQVSPEAVQGGLEGMALMAATAKLKARGNQAFRAGRWAAAAADYRGAIGLIVGAREARRLSVESSSGQSLQAQVPPPRPPILTTQNYEIG